MDIQKIIAEVTREVAEAPRAAEPMAEGMAPEDMPKYIDHTYLKPQASLEDIRRICDEAKKFGTASVCVNPSYIGFVAEQLKGTSVTPCCVVAFPLGACTPETKAFEAFDAVNRGAREVDMVINIGAVKSGDWKLVKRDIEGVVNAVKGRAKVKVIIETCLLTDEEKVRACTVSKLAGADFVKTSTGFNGAGATEEAVRIMLDTAAGRAKVKPSGGIRNYETAKMYVDMGVDRLGIGYTSCRPIVEGGSSTEAY